MIDQSTGPNELSPQPRHKAGAAALGGCLGAVAGSVTGGLGGAGAVVLDLLLGISDLARGGWELMAVPVAAVVGAVLGAGGGAALGALAGWLIARRTRPRPPLRARTAVLVVVVCAVAGGIVYAPCALGLRVLWGFGRPDGLRHVDLRHVAAVGAALGAVSGAALGAALVLWDMRRWWPVLVGVAGASAVLLASLLGLTEPGVGGTPLREYIAALESPGGDDTGDKFRAAQALALLGPAAERAVPALIETLQKGAPGSGWNWNSSLRSQCAAALGAIGPGAKDAVPALIVALQDQDPSLRRQSSTALGDIGPGAGEAMPALVEAALKDDDPDVQQYAAVALGKLGPGARRAIPAVVGTLQAEPEHPAAGLALLMIGPMASEAALVQTLGLRKLHVKFPRGAFQRLTDFVNLRSLTFPCATDQDLEYVGSLANLQKLDLQNAPVTDAGLRHLAGLTKLQWLAVGASDPNGPNTVGDGCLKHLIRLTGLRSLYLYGGGFSGTGLRQLGGMAGLRTLGIGEAPYGIRAPITDAGWEALGDLKELDSLELDRIWIGDAGMKSLGKLTKLRKLRLKRSPPVAPDPGITDRGLAHLEGLSQLEALELQFVDVKAAGLQHLRHLSHLRTIKIDYDGPDAGLAHLQGLAKLETLMLGGTQIDGSGLKHLAACRNLHTLEVPSERLTDSGMEQIGRLTSLEVLYLTSARGWPWSASTTDASLRHLAGLTRLRALWLPEVGDAGIVHFRGLKNLESLHLGSSRISASGLGPLQGLTRLRTLELHGAGVSDKALEPLRGLINLRSLIIDGTKVTDAGLESLKGLKNLQRLSVGPKVSGAGVAELRRALPQLKVTLSH
jgi:Leucine-rich repeat (LRR) protein